MRKERDDLKRDLAVVTVRLEETEKRATIFERAKDAAEVDRDAWRQQAQALAEKLQEPDRFRGVVQDLQKQLNGAEARIAALAGSERPQDGPSVIPGAATPAGGRLGLLARFLGRD